MKDDLTLNEYQSKALETAIYGEGSKINYPILGLIGEAGELANKYKKVLRDDGGILSDIKKEELIMELSDVLWYCAALAKDLDTDLNTICQKNIKKLLDRRARNVIQGSGDNR
jgi:NTP pyrophosphatase (non-canonical NTP hydrolase)